GCLFPRCAHGGRRSSAVQPCDVLFRLILSEFEATKVTPGKEGNKPQQPPALSTDHVLPPGLCTDYTDCTDWIPLTHSIGGIGGRIQHSPHRWNRWITTFVVWAASRKKRSIGRPSAPHTRGWPPQPTWTRPLWAWWRAPRKRRPGWSRNA